jgi:hypothetical protein
MQNTIKKGMLGAILGVGLVAGLAGTGVVAANAAQWGDHGDRDRGYQRTYDHDRGRGYYEQRTYRPVVENYIPPCPGEGYTWTAGYYNGGYWVPGSWVFRGYRGVDRGYAYGGYNGYDRDRHYDRDGRRDDRGRDNRGWNRGDGGHERDGRR